MMRVEQVTSDAAIDRLVPEWQALWQRVSGATPFQSPEWLLSWWSFFGNGAPSQVGVGGVVRLVGHRAAHGHHVPLARQCLGHHIRDVRAGRAHLDHGRDRRGRLEVHRHPLLAERGIELRAADQAPGQAGRERHDPRGSENAADRPARLWHACQLSAPRNIAVFRPGTSASTDSGGIMAALIEDYALIGDMHTAALVSRDGSVDWLCVPRFDSAACLAALLGDAGNGQWRISPTAADGPQERRGQVTRRYEDSSLILETEWQTVGGTVRVIDFMPPRDDEPPVLVRIVEGVQGAVEMECVWRLRFDYGKVLPWVRRIDHAIMAVAGPDSVWLRTPVKLIGHDLAHEASFTVRAGERVPFVFSWTPSHLGAPPVVDAFEALDATRKFWSGWVAKCTYQGRYADAVIRSLITLKALTYAPTGGIVAAPTTSLPEDLGGVRNWDYRYCWLRDATITLEALLRTGYTEEASAWREWLGRTIAGDPRRRADHVRRGGRAQARGVAGRLAARLRELGAGADRQCRGQPAAARRLRRGDRRDHARQPGGAVASTATPGAWCGPCSGSSTKNWDQPDEGIWEVRGPAQALRAFQGDGVGRLRPGGARGRAGQAGRRDPVARDPRPDHTPKYARRATTPSAARSPSTTAAPSSTRRCC